jgi:hypothetical protein
MKGVVRLTDGLTIDSLRSVGPVLVLIATLGVVLAGAMIGKDGARRRGLLVVALAGLAVAIICALRLNPQSATRNRPAGLPAICSSIRSIDS